MRIVLKVVTLIAALIAAPVAAFIAYDLQYFEPRKAEIEQIINTAEPEDSVLPVRIESLLMVGLHGQTTWPTARMLIRRLRIADEPIRPSSWVVLGATWNSLVKVHLDERERLAILASSLPTGEGRFGLSNTSRALYCKPLSALTNEEAAELVALAMQPGLSKRPAQLVAQAGKLLGTLPAVQ